MDEALRQLVTLGRGYFDKKQYAQAEKYLTQVVEQNQSFADVYNMLGVIYHDQGQFARAQRAFEAALRLNPSYTDAALNLAVIYNDMGKYREAKEVYQGALSRQRGSPSQMDPDVLGKFRTCMPISETFLLRVACSTKQSASTGGTWVCAPRLSTFA